MNKEYGSLGQAQIDGALASLRIKVIALAEERNVLIEELKKAREEIERLRKNR